MNEEADDRLPLTDCSPSDSDRLDWLQKRQKTVWRETHEEWCDTTEFPFRKERITVFDGWVVNEGDDPRQSIREAIDAAIHSENS